ncbi:MAG: zinc ABC transporter substrate-binding protein, partial [Pseudomonadota bacterium]
MKTYLLATAALSTLAAPALAAPQVAVDILPVHSLVSRVMDGVGEPTLVVPPGISPHGYAMRPSEAAAVQDADVVFWIGEELNPAFARSVESLMGDAQTVALLNVPNAIRLEFREGATFEAHDHGHEGHGHEEAAAHDDHGHNDHAHDDDDDHGHDDHAKDDHGHDEAAAHDDHGHDDHDQGHIEAAAQDHHGHDHDDVDPHAWLDPQNAKIWVDAIAAAMSQADPENASTYFGNAAVANPDFDAGPVRVGYGEPGFRAAWLRHRFAAQHPPTLGRC